jgi:AcrR family transcriptional regulator
VVEVTAASSAQPVNGEALPRRADARRNRERVIAAAEAVLAERGLHAEMSEIADRAGVGKGTVYRSFPTKEHLLCAVAVKRLGWMRARFEEAQEDEDAWAALRAAMMTIAERQASDLGLVVSIASTVADHPDLRDERLACDVALLDLMQRAQRGGQMRRGVKPDDLRVLFGGISRVLAERRCHDAADWRRATALVIDGLRADGPPGPLPRAGTAAGAD